MEKDEQWLPISGYEGVYEISNMGNVRSLDRVIVFSDGRKRKYNGQVIQHAKNLNGYHIVNLSRKTFIVHTLVLETFIGKRPDGHEGCHGVKGRDDNSINNLRWDTVLENRRDIVRHGNHFEANKTECNAGHQFSEANTLIVKTGRVCRTCKALRDKQYKERKKK